MKVILMAKVACQAFPWGYTGIQSLRYYREIAFSYPTKDKRSATKLG